MNSLNKNTPTCALTDIMKHPLKSPEKNKVAIQITEPF
jgi:hypothetical protein